MMKIITILLITFLLIGCASSGQSMQKSSKSIKNVTNFNSAISAYATTKDMQYLKAADKYATTEKEKAILERKMVDYLGVDKVFDMQITHKLSNFKGKTSSGFLGQSRNSSKNNILNIHISVNKNLPFTLKYNSYKLGIYLEQKAQYKRSYLSYHRYRNGSSPEITIQNDNEIIYRNRNITLSSQNNWSYHKNNIHDKVLFYEKSSTLDTVEYSLLDLTYKVKLALVRLNIVDTKNQLIWQNNFSDTGGKPPLIVTSHGNNVKTCKKLGNNWRLPLQSEIALYKKSNFPDRNLHYWHYQEYTKSGKISKYVRCVKNTNPTFIDRSSKLEWENNIYLSKLRKTYDANYPGKGIRKGGTKYCASKGSGWRLPSIEEFRNFYKKGSLFKDNMDLRYDAEKSRYNQDMHYVTTTNGVFFEIEYDRYKEKYLFHNNTGNNWGLVKCVQNIK